MSYSLEIVLLKNIFTRFGLLPEAYPEEYEQVWSKLSKMELSWKKIDEGYQVKFRDQFWKLQVNQRTNEPRYTLFIKKVAILSCDILPNIWHLNA